MIKSKDLVILIIGYVLINQVNISYAIKGK